MKFVVGFILIALLILAELQKEKMSLLMNNNLVKVIMLLSIVFIFKTKNIVLGVISGLVFLCLLVMTSKPSQEGFNNYGSSNKVDAQEHTHIVQGANKDSDKPCNKLKLVPYKKKKTRCGKDLVEDSDEPCETKSSKNDIEELLQRSSIRSINIDFNDEGRFGGKEAKAICPPGFKGPNKRGNCTARWVNGCGFECHKRKCESYGGVFTDHDFGDNVNYTCIPISKTPFTSLSEKQNQIDQDKLYADEFNKIDENLDSIQCGLNHSHDTEFNKINNSLEEISEQMKNDTTPPNVKNMPSESGRGTDPASTPLYNEEHTAPNVKNMPSKSGQETDPTSTPLYNEEHTAPTTLNQYGDKNKDYRGNLNKTLSGKTCQRWDSQSPHKHKNTKENIPGAGLDENYCRNPDNDKNIWCYTTDPEKRFDYCASVSEPKDEKIVLYGDAGNNDNTKFNLVGDVDGVGGKMVQAPNGKYTFINRTGNNDKRLTSEYDLDHDFYYCSAGYLYPTQEQSIRQCGSAKKVNINLYNEEHTAPTRVNQYGTKNKNYRGNLNKTVSGLTCQRWDSQRPHGHGRTKHAYKSSGLDKNYCRNPDNDKNIWCYTTDPKKRFDYCVGESRLS